MPILKLNDYVVPRGIRFISELGTDFRFYKFPVKCIINKQLPGCGFTEYCLRGPENVILCSPRKMLLKNKKDQHKDSVYLVVNELEKELTVDKDLSKIDKTRSQVFMDTLKEVVHGKDTVYNRLMNEIKDYLNERKYLGDKPCKILVTYDSYRIVKDILTSLGIFQSFYTIIDEFQTILHDSKFKSNTELDFLYHLHQSHSALFVSATPMLEEYLNMLGEFDGLPYINMDWSKEDSTRVLKPALKVLTMKSVGEKLPEIIQSYKDGNFERAIRMVNGYPVEIISDEAVFYVNSVNHITSIIKKCNLQPEEVNILCSDTPDNQKRIQRKLGKKFVIGDSAGSPYGVHGRRQYSGRLQRRSDFRFPAFPAVRQGDGSQGHRQFRLGLYRGLLRGENGLRAAGGHFRFPQGFHHIQTAYVRPVGGACDGAGLARDHRHLHPARHRHQRDRPRLADTACGAGDGSASLR